MEELLFGIPVPAIIYLLIQLLKKVNLIKTGDQTRLVNAAFSGLFAVLLMFLLDVDAEWVRMATLIGATFYNAFVSALTANATQPAQG